MGDMILSDGSKMNIEKINPLDAVFDEPDQVPDDVKTKRYGGLDGYTISEVAAKVAKDYGKIDILVHSLANGPEVTKPLLEHHAVGTWLPRPHLPTPWSLLCSIS